MMGWMMRWMMVDDRVGRVDDVDDVDDGVNDGP